MAERSQSTRSGARKRAAPYPNSRPARADSPPPPISSKLSLSSMFSGLVSFITHPFASQQPALIGQSDQLRPSVSDELSACALHDRGQEMETEAQAQQQLQQNVPPPPPLQDLPPPPRRQPEAAADTSGAGTYGTVADFLKDKQKKGQQLNAVEIAGVMSLLNQSIGDDEEREPFRFSSSPSAPIAGPSTSTSGGTFLASASEPALGETQAQRPPRMLSKNPNGPYRWNGAASARPRRHQNRYASPAFGTPRTSSHIRLSPKPSPEKEKAEAKGKRRRVDEQTGKGETVSLPNGNANGRQTAVSSVPFPSTSGTSSSPQAAPRTNGAPAAPNTPPRSRATGLQTKPAVPSPLRQAWRAEPDSPPTTLTFPPTTSASMTVRPTRAAAAMAEIIKEASPKSEVQKRREAFANPYEAMSPVPVKPIPRKPLPPRKRKVAETEKPEEKGGQKKVQKEKEVEKDAKEMPLSPQKIIEATVPKGAKRSRPPPEFEKEKEKKAQAAAAQSEPSLRRSARLKSPEPAVTPSITGFGLPPSRKVSPPQPSIVVEEVPDDESPRKKARTSPTINSAAKLTAINVEEVEDVDMTFAGKSALPAVKPSQVIEIDDDEQTEKARKEKSPSPTSASNVGTNGFTSTTKLSPLSGLKSSAPRVSSKLRYSYQAETEEKEDKGKGKEREQSDTRGLDLLSSAAVPGAPKLAPAKLPGPSPFGATTAATSSPFGATAVTSSSFGLTTSSTFSAPSGSAAPSPVSSPSLTLKQPLVSSPKPAPKTTDEVKSAVSAMAVVDLPVYSFCIPPSSPGAGPSTLKARQTAKAELVSSLPTYDLSGPAGTAPTSGFNWDAAGMKMPAAPADGSWICSECTLSNSSSAKDECAICKAPRPRSVTAPAKNEFDWGAAGMKRSEPAAYTWTCSQCMLSNPASAKDECTICKAPRPGSAPAPATSGFNWAAAGMKKPAEAEDKWTCGDCMLQNPASAKEKCTVCEAPRPGYVKGTGPATGGFDWAAAGMKKPENTGGWTCSTCMVLNLGSAKKCVACETDR